MANTLAFFDQMNGVNYSTLSSTSFQLGIVDPDTTGLTSSQLGTLESSGKTIIGYLSIGEAENFRSYWQPSWNTTPPSFLMAQDPNWPGDYNVKYWDPAWQQIVINQATTMAKAGYNGIMLDVVDAYTVASVAAADGGIANARADMIKFVEAISAATKAINPNFKIIQNNALDLLTTNPDDPTSATNTAYLSHIDGLVAEDTFYNGNSTASWSAWNVQYLEHAVTAGKDVLAIDYPTSTTAQQSFISQAIADGFVPFAGTQDLNSIPAINSQIPAELPAGALSELTGNTVTTTGGGSTGGGTTGGTTSYNVYNVASGNNTIAATMTNEEFVISPTYHGQSSIQYFGTDVGDAIALPSSLYATAAQALSNVTYSSNGNAVIHLSGTDTITILNAGINSLVAADFNIYASGSTGGTGGGSIAATQGLASYTPTEIASLASTYHAGGTSDTITVLNSIVSSANSVLNVTPQPASTIVTSGTAAQTGQIANTGTVSTQASEAYSLALAYEVTGNTSYLTQAKSFLLSWAQTNVPIGDPIANAGLLPMFKAYDLISSQFSAAGQTTISNWMSGIANAIITTQTQAASSGSDTAINNHESFALLEVGTIGAVLGNNTFIHYLTDNFQNHIGVNLQSIAGEPPYLGVDYQERDAYHYVAYNLQALGQAAILMDQFSHVSGNPYGITYNPFTVQVNGASIENTLDVLLPFATGQQQSLNEFQNSTDPNDATRLANGSLSSVFQPSDAIAALEAADYFGHTVNDPLTGQSYNLAQVTASILQNEEKLTLPAALPDQAFLQNDITSSYDTTPPAGGSGGTTTPPVTIKVPTSSGHQTYDASAGNDTFTFYKHTGQTTINHFGGGDILNIESKIYTSTAQALSHVQYSGGNAVLALDTGNSITLVGVADHALTASDFHIFS